MAKYVLIHGSSSNSGYWRLVAPRLTAAGHEVVAPDLPTTADSAGFGEYTDAVIGATGGDVPVILVAQSMGAYTAPIVATRVPTELIVLLAPMVPTPGEPPRLWWENTGQPQAQQEMAAEDGFTPGLDTMEIFLHDVPEDLVATLMREGEPEQSFAIFGQPWPLPGWPDVPTRVLLGDGDRLFPVRMMRQVVKDRLGITPDEIRSGHLLALSHPDQVVAELERYRTEADR